MAKKDKKLGKTGVILIAVLLIGSTLAIGLRSLGGEEKPQVLKNTEKIEFQNYTFYYEEKSKNYYAFANINKNQIEYVSDPNKATTRFGFRVDPRKVSGIPLEEGAVDTIVTSDKVYISFNPNQKNLSKVSIAGAQVSRLTGKVYKINTVGAYTEDAQPIEPSVPLRNCTDATNTTTVITLKVGDETEITSEDNCVFVKGKTPDKLIKAADKLGYNLVGIEI